MRPTPPPQPRTERERSSSGPPTGYEPAFTVWLSPRVVRWITPVALFLVLLLMFFPWTGVRPGGYAIYTQNAFQMIWGGYSVDPTGEKVLGMEKTVSAAIRANWYMVFYFLLIVAALLLAATPPVLARISYPLPGALQRIWPWHTVLSLVATLLAFLLLLALLVNRPGLENAVIAAVEKGAEKDQAPSRSLEEQIELGLRLSRLGLTRTLWLRCAVLLHAIALAGAGLELWLERRGQRPLPRLEGYG